MAEANPLIPHLGNWSIQVSRFLDEVPPSVVPDGVRNADAMAVVKTLEGLEVRFLSGGTATEPFPCRLVEDDVLEMEPAASPASHSFVLRTVSSSAGDAFLVGVWLGGGGKGDAPVGVWVSKEEGRDDDE